MGIPFRASPDAQGQGGFRTQAVVFLHDHGVELQLGVAGPEPVKAPFDALAVDVAGLTDGLDLQGDLMERTAQSISAASTNVASLRAAKSCWVIS